MELLKSGYWQYQKMIEKLSGLNGLPALMLRLYLAPVLIQAG